MEGATDDDEDKEKGKHYPGKGKRHAPTYQVLLFINRFIG